MPRYFCDYCDTFLTHDSPSVRKTHNSGRKHKDNVRLYYQQWYDENIRDKVAAQGGNTFSNFSQFQPYNMPPSGPAPPMPPFGGMPMVRPPAGMPPMPPGGMMPPMMPDPSRMRFFPPDATSAAPPVSTATTTSG